ncbi:hypothetical protein LIER_08891 [Lithospermum erythrorhizon]|uniref:Uncharacterized protein n=1 Tax=Lithospermum erythrorhizon TaxID=34254 RepID=A0AAV3PEV3_LITER
MLQMRVFLLTFLSVLLIISSFPRLIHSSDVAASIVPPVPGKRHRHQEVHQKFQRQNHGSFRGPHKHLINPTIDHPFHVPEMAA